MIKEHLVSASVTNGTECICNPEVLLGTKYGLWDFEKEQAPRGALLDLNAAWELFLSKKGFSNVSFETQEHHQHEVIDGVVYNEGDTTYVLKDTEGNPTGATFTIKANKGPIEHIEWEDGKLILYYTKLRPLEDKDLQNGVPIHYVTNEDGTVIIDEETGLPLIYDYVMIPVLEIFDNDETRLLFPWFADDENTVRLRTAIEGKNGHLGRMAITPESEVFIAKDTASFDNVELLSILSVIKQLNKDLGFDPKYVADTDHQSPDGVTHNFRVDGSELSDKLNTTNKTNIVKAINEVYSRTRVNTRLMADTAVDDLNNWKTLLEFADSIKNNAFKDSKVPNLLDALNWMQTVEIGPFVETINSDINAENITEALNNIFTEAEENRDRIGYNKQTKEWIELTTDNKDTLTEAINEVDEHVNALADIVDVEEKWDPVNKKTYYSNPNLNDITKTRLRFNQTTKDNISVIEAVNELQALIGNLSSSKSGDSSIELTTNNKDSVVEAINEVDLHADNNFETIGAEYNLDAVGKKSGEITNLTTNTKTSIVAAINELDERVGELDDLPTDDKENIVSSILEVVDKQPFVYEDSENPDSGVILKNHENHAGQWSLAIGESNDITEHSFTSGKENVSQGHYTTITGFRNTSKKKFSTINGKSNSSDGNYNLVNGLSNNVIGDNNIVSGSNNIITGDNSTILGDNIYAKNVDNIIAAGDTIITKDNIKDGIALGKNDKLNGDKAVAVGTSNFVSEKSVAIGENNEIEGVQNSAFGSNNYLKGEKSIAIGDANNTEGDNNYSVGNANQVKGDNNFSIGKNQNVEGNNNTVIGSDLNVKAENAIVIGEINEVHDNSTHIGRDIYIQTHNTESQLQKLIFVDLNDWCKKNNAASLNGEKFLDSQHVVNALKVYLSKEYTDSALLRFTMQSNENGIILVQGKSKRIYINGTWYFSDDIENGWSRHDGEYLKVIENRTVDSNGNALIKRYLAFMDQLSTEAIVDTVGAQRSNTEDYKSIDLTHAYGAVDIDDIADALELKDKFNSKVDKYAKIITKYLDEDGVIYSKELNYVDSNNPNISGNITLSLQDSFGFNKFDYQTLSEKGKAGGYVPLDTDGKINSDFLPSYVDDVIDVWAEYTVAGNYDLVDIHLYLIINDVDSSGSEVIRKGEPILEGEKGKIYVEAQPKLDGKVSYLFRYTGTKFVAIGAHIVIGETEGTAFDGARGKTLEDAFKDHEKSGTTSISVIDETTGYLKKDSDGNPIWATYKPNPHNVTAEQLEVIVNDPNSENNTGLDDTYIVSHTVKSAITTLFDRLNVTEDSNSSVTAVLGTAEDLESLDKLDDIEGNDSPTVIGTILSNKNKIDNFNSIDSSSIDNLVDDYFNLDDVNNGDVDDDF